MISCKQKQDDGILLEIGGVKMANGKFVGSWALKAWTAELSDGKIVYPFGEDVLGQITYDDNGNMAVQIMRKDRTPFSGVDPFQASPEEVVEAFHGFLSYCGKYDVDTDAGQVIHHLKISSIPNWTGQDQIRNFEFDGDQLTLSTDFIGASRHRLVWGKVKG